MSPAATFLATLRQQGAELSIERGDIKVKGPGRAFNAETHQKLAYFRTELIDLLWGDPALGEDRTFSPAAEQDGTDAVFAGGLLVQLRTVSIGRWTLWYSHGAAWRKRKGFATAFLDHGRRTAEQWYGEPIGGWHAPEGASK
jgi:hypothetical protein